MPRKIAEREPYEKPSGNLNLSAARPVKAKQDAVRYRVPKIEAHMKPMGGGVEKHMRSKY